MRGWLTSIAWCLAYAAVAAVVADWAIATQRRTAALERERRSLQREAARLRRQNACRVEAIHAFQNDAFLVERVLREQYGFRRIPRYQPGDRYRQSPRRGGAYYALAGQGFHRRPD
jgi:hypothetical protein